MLSFPRSICRKYISTWRDVDPNEIQVELMQAGLSNKLFILSVPNKEPSKAFLRLYGPLRQTLAKIIDEQTILEVLTEVKLTAKIYASFEEGRIEEFLNGQMLTIDEFYTEPIYKKLISKLHLLHNLQKVKPKLLTLKGNETAIISIIREWVVNVKNFYLKNPEKTKQFVEPVLKDSFVNDFQDLSLPIVLEETEKCISAFHENKFNINIQDNIFMDVVFCHSDIHSQNALIDNDKLHLVDYEFSGFNYRAYELAVIFTEKTISYTVKEPPYFKYNWEAKHYPDETEIGHFIELYLLASQEYKSLATDKNYIRDCARFVLIMSLFAQLFSFYWALVVIQLKNESVHFDYFYFSYMKYKAYLSMKELLIEKKIISRY